MCGIVGYVSKKKDGLIFLIDGLKALEYRGYDSAGISYFEDGKEEIKTIKEKGKVSELEHLIDFSRDVTIGIAHTRWATHGIPDKRNAHPHSSGKITIVHNGIIENYEGLKKSLINKGYDFASDTDSEVVAVLLDDLYKSCDLLTAISRLKDILKGSYALVIMCEDYRDRLFAIRKDSPLLIANDDSSSYVASDILAFVKRTVNYSILEEGDIAVLESGKIEVLDNNLNKKERKIISFDGDVLATEKNGFFSFMQKEIWEEKDVIKRLIENYGTLEKLDKNLSFLKDVEKIDIVACGSAYHVGVTFKYLLEEFASIPANVEVASEYRYKRNFLDKNDLAVFISQSGETADTLASLRKVKEQNVNTLGIVNVVGSTIAREADRVMYTLAGPEIAVATTKAFVAQLVAVILITLYLSYNKGKITKEFLLDTLDNLSNMDNMIDSLLNNKYSDIVNILKDKNNIFFIGRNIDYAIALEGSLKLKEISYIHSEAYAAGELKHGTISLIEKDTPVIAIVTKDAVKDKTVSNIKEVKARGAYVIAVTDEVLTSVDNYILLPSVNEFLLPILAVILLQLISHEVAKAKGCDIDKPRNLAKSVTVE